MLSQALPSALLVNKLSDFPLGPNWLGAILPPGVAMSYSYRCEEPRLLSEACRPILGKLTDGPLGRIIDLCFVIDCRTCSTGFDWRYLIPPVLARFFL